VKLSPRPSRLAHRWRWLPRRTIRLRLTLIYGGLFIVSGAALLGITYVLVSARYTTEYFLGVGQQAAGELTIHQNVLGGSVSLSGRASGSVPRVFATGGELNVTVPVPVGGRTRNVTTKLPSGKVLAASARAQSSAALRVLLIASAIALAIMAAIGTWLGWVVSGRALRPLRAITATARDISASNLHRRLALDGPDDELRELGRTFDGLLERLESAFTAQRQFAANVSHELRTPLTFERTLLEVALADPDANFETLRAACEKVLANSEHQERLIEALLVMSRSQRGLDRTEPIDLAAVVSRVLGGIDASGLTVESTLQPTSIEGDSRLLERLVANLIGNAVVHNRPGGWLRVSTRAGGGRATLAVANSGARIRPDDLDRLFEPFQRLEGSRISDSDGLGLGLSIVRSIAEAHGATITTALPPDGGLSIEVSFGVGGPSQAGADPVPDPLD
jgi:signal transduction histidine kinase